MLWLLGRHSKPFGKVTGRVGRCNGRSASPHVITSRPGINPGRVASASAGVPEGTERLRFSWLRCIGWLSNTPYRPCLQSRYGHVESETHGYTVPARQDVFIFRRIKSPALHSHSRAFLIHHSVWLALVPDCSPNKRVSLSNTARRSPGKQSPRNRHLP